MGCPCRQIRAAIEHLPGGKFLTGLLPALPTDAKGPSMKMLARSPGQTFHLAHGAHYRADAERIVYVETADVAEMRRVGCIEAPADEPAAPAPAAPETAAEPDSLAEFAASLPEGPSKRFAEHPEQ
jgi:hypothetical protein